MLARLTFSFFFIYPNYLIQIQNWTKKTYDPHYVTIASPSPVLFIVNLIIIRYKGCPFYLVPELYRIESLHPPGRLRAEWYDKIHALCNNLLTSSVNKP